MRNREGGRGPCDVNEGGSGSRTLTPLPSGQPAKLEVPVEQDPPRLETRVHLQPGASAAPWGADLLTGFSIFMNDSGDYTAG